MVLIKQHMAGQPKTLQCGNKKEKTKTCCDAAEQADNYVAVKRLRVEHKENHSEPQDTHTRGRQEDAATRE